MSSENKNDTDIDVSKEATGISETDPVSSPSVPVASVPIHITLLLVSGLRVPLTVDTDFISSHELPSDPPHSLLIGSVKSALFTDWKEEWGIAPVSPTNIRFIHYGKVLDDSQTLQDCGLAGDSPQNVVHMSVKPASFELDIAAKPQRSKFSRPRTTEDDNGSSNSRCCIIC